jgi:hypothetical protein
MNIYGLSIRIAVFIIVVTEAVLSGGYHVIRCGIVLALLYLVDSHSMAGLVRMILDRVIPDPGDSRDEYPCYIVNSSPYHRTVG